MATDNDKLINNNIQQNFNNQNIINKKLTKLIDADGIILSAETEIVSLIEEKLDIKIDIPDQ